MFFFVFFFRPTLNFWAKKIHKTNNQITMALHYDIYFTLHNHVYWLHHDKDTFTMKMFCLFTSWYMYKLVHQITMFIGYTMINNCGDIHVYANLCDRVEYTPCTHAKPSELKWFTLWNHAINRGFKLQIKYSWQHDYPCFFQIMFVGDN